MKHKIPNLLKPLVTIIHQNSQFYCPSEPFSFHHKHFNVRHPVFSGGCQNSLKWAFEFIFSSIFAGVIDDRGKFIFISQEELEAVGKFITQRGRVSISELAENSNRLISLETKSSIWKLEIYTVLSLFNTHMPINLNLFDFPPFLMLLNAIRIWG